jgi:hypothetical protein
MTPEQLDRLIDYIDKRARYEAMAATDDEWPSTEVRDAGKALVAAMLSATVQPAVAAANYTPYGYPCPCFGDFGCGVCGGTGVIAPKSAPTFESIRFDSDCVVNGVEIKAGTTFKSDAEP